MGSKSDLQTLPDEEVKDLNVKKRMLIDPKQTEQRQAVLDLIQRHPETLKSIHTQEKSLEQLLLNIPQL